MSAIEQEVGRRRTFAIISHPDAGKTTLTEKLLLFGGAIKLAGTVKGRKASRHATSDWMKLEQERGISVTSSVMQFPFADTVVNLLDTILNPRADRRAPLHWDENRLLASQMVDAGTLLLVGRDGLSLGRDEQHVDVRLYSVRQFPQAWAGWGMGELTGDLLSNTLRLPCPFLYTLTVHVPDQVIAAHGARIKAARATQMADSPMGRFLPAWRERKQDWDYVNRMIEGGHKLLQASFQVVLFCPEGEGDHAEQRLNALFESKGWTLQKDRFTALHAFLSALPLSAGPNTIREMATLGRLRSFLTWSCVNTAPVAAEGKGSRSPLLMLVGRRGQITYIDPFDNEKGNFNIAVAAASGAGKSFFTQEMVMSLLGTGGRPNLRFFDIARGAFMPVEFAGAAYRLGHSMVRPRGGGSATTSQP